MKSSKLSSTLKPTFRFELGAGFALFCALVYFFGEGSFLGALLAAVAVHELGHMLLMLFFGAYPTHLKTALSGLQIDYSGNISPLQEMLTALGGPALGLLFSVVCASLGRHWGSDFLILTAGLGFILNAFNFLPAEPLDGGRILDYVLRALFSEEAAQRVLPLTGYLTSALLAGVGIFSFSKGLGPAPLLAGLWLFILQQNKSCKWTRSGIQ